MHRKKPFEFLDIVMLAVVGVASLLAVPQIARGGLTQLFFMSLMGVMFFAPLALFCAELGSAFPRNGGLYIWIREAFGEKISLLAIWIYWLYNIIWFPAILLVITNFFIAAISTDLTANPYYSAILAGAIYWTIVWINSKGAQALSYFTTLSGIIGLLVPTFMISILAIIWVATGNPSHLTFTKSAFFPSFKSIGGFLIIATIVFEMVGLELPAAHSDDLEEPKKNYPKSLIASSIIIFAMMIFSSLSIAVVVPNHHLNTASGIVESFALFFNQFDLPILGVIFAFFVSFGLIGAVSAWNATLPKYFIAASEDGSIPPSLVTTNERGTSPRFLAIQGFFVTLLIGISIWMKNAQIDYAVIAEVTTQLAMLPYLFLFLAGLRLRFTHQEIKRPFSLPKPLLWIAGTLGIISCLLALFLGFFPKGDLALLNLHIYQTYLAIGIVLACAIPMVYSGVNRR
ncbi:MAG: APC family permease [Simkaniaceae bacterium]|nr:APC family permease [Simkaniaceae bacterium]